MRVIADTIYTNNTLSTSTSDNNHQASRASVAMVPPIGESKELPVSHGRRRPRDDDPPRGSGAHGGHESKNDAPATNNKRARLEVRPFFVHQWLDVCDSSGKWYEAQVIAIETKSNDTIIPATSPSLMAHIHYKGLHARYDEWLQYGVDRHRYDPLYTHTERPRQYGYVLPRVGTPCDMRDTTDAWLAAEVVAVNDDTKQIQLHYLDWADKYNEWIDMDSPRLAPRGTFTANTTKGSGAASASPVTPISSIVGVEESKTNGGFAASADEENKYRELLRTKNGFIILPMDSDGNCLFRSVSNSVYGVPDHHAMVRAKCMEYMEKQSYFFKSFVAGDLAEYITRLRRDGEWGDHVELQAITEIYDRPVEIFAYSTIPVVCFGNRVSSSTRPPIRLSYHSRSHYNAIVHPVTHASTVLTTPPGEVEDHRIRLNARPSGGLEHATYTSDVEATERESFALALQVSRQEFATSRSVNQTSDDLLQAALQASLKQHQDIQAAQAAEALRVSRVQYEQQQDHELAAALAQSLVGIARADSNGALLAATAASGGSHSNGAFDDDEQLMNQAIFSSLLDSRPAVPSNAATTAATTPPVVTSTPAAAVQTAEATVTVSTTPSSPAGSDVAVIANVAPSGDVVVAVRSPSVIEHRDTTTIDSQSSDVTATLVVTAIPAIAPMVALTSPAAPPSASLPLSPSNNVTAPPPPPATTVARVPTTMVPPPSLPRPSTDGVTSPVNSANNNATLFGRSLSADKDKSPRSTSGGILRAASPSLQREVSGGSSNTSIGDVVNHCHQTLKYPLTRCVKAYSMYANQPLSPRELQQKMIAYLSSSSSSRSHSRSPTSAGAAAAVVTSSPAAATTRTTLRRKSSSTGAKPSSQTAALPSAGATGNTNASHRSRH